MRMQKHSVSILIPTKNRSSLLVRALNSVVAQKVQADEVVIVNDGGCDDTAQVVGDFVRTHGLEGVCTYIERKKSGGVNAARNQGLSIIRSEWVLFLDDDDALVPEAIMIVKQKIQQADQCEVLFFNTHIQTDTETFTGGFQFEPGITSIDPTYEEVMTKFGLRGDCKPVFNMNLFKNEQYRFPEVVNGFESVTLRTMRKDGHRMRYYADITTHIDQRSSFDHVSTSAPAKKPYWYLWVHVQDLYTHLYFYLSHPRVGLSKIKEMMKLAIRSVYTLIRNMIYVGVRLITHIRYIRLGVRYRLAFLLPKIDKDFTVSFFGYTYSGTMRDYIDRYVFFFGAYKYEELLFLKQYLSPQAVVFDVGANTGHHTLFFSRFAHRVYAFEPYAKLVYLMRQRCIENNIANVDICMYGLGKHDDCVDFFAPTGHNSGIGSFVRSEVGTMVGKLEIKKGDIVVSNSGITRVDLIKIDVEGVEMDVIQGLAETIQKNTPVLFIEASPESQKNLSHVLAGLGQYVCYIIDPNNPFLLLCNKPGCLLTPFVPQRETKNIVCIPQHKV